MSNKTVGVIWNPSKIEEEPLRAAIEGELGDEVELLWWATLEDDPGAGMAREAVAAGCTALIAVGGDGTVRAVAESLAGTGVGLIIVPQGTGNLLARNLDIPLDDIPAALRRIKGDTRPIDLGWVEFDGEWHAFAVMIGFGVDAQMLIETDEDLKDRAGWLAYVEAMGRALAGTEMTSITVTVDDEEPHEVRAHTLLIGNCGVLQGGLRLLPDAVPDDGVLDVLMINADGPLQWLDTVRSVVWDNGIRRLLSGSQEAVSTQTTTHLAAQRFAVELAGSQRFEIDGEEVGDVTGFVVEVQPAALSVY